MRQRQQDTMSALLLTVHCMRTSQYLLATEKQTPNDAELVSHQLMLRAGLIRKLASGVYTWLPTGLRVLHNVTRVVREEMQRAGAVEMLMPNILPAELIQESDRWDKFGPDLLKIKDRHQRDFCFGPTHEEVITDIARREIRSYKQLPLNLFQIQTKFRDEIRPRFGVMRAREFVMKDAYSFHTNEDSLQQTYQVMREAYSRTLKRLGLEARAVIADSGAIGGETSHEFQVLANAGEDDIFYSDASDYAANIEKATCAAPSQARPEATQALKEFATPDIKTIAALCKQLAIKPAQTVKTMIGKNAQGDFFAFVLRGDHTLNEIKAAKLAQVAGTLTLANDQEIKALMGAGPGSLGPVNCKTTVIVDRDAAVLADFSCGANKDGYHFKGVNWDRDVTNYQVADIRNVVEGDPSPDGKGILKRTRGIEVGHIFQLGTHYSAIMGASVLNEAGKATPLLMGCYGFGVSRIIAAAIEQHHDAHGIIWPKEMAPFSVAIVPIQYDRSAAVKAKTDEIYAMLTAQGIEVLLDDRHERPGVRFADMDLLGMPHRLVISDKNLDNALIEYKGRHCQEPELLTINEAILRVSQ